MLKSLYISSFVIIDEMHVDFHEGMNVLTGETGAGKSIIIDAIGQLCGHRATSSFVRKGCPKAVIEGIFEVTESDALKEAFETIGIDYDNEIMITKEIFSNGKSSIKINYRHATNNALKIIAPFLIHLHSQFETQTLFAPARHIVLLDQYNQSQLRPLKQAYAETYQAYRKTLREIAEIEEEDFSDEQIEFYQAQYEELKDLTYTDEDVEALEDEAEMMKNFEDISIHVQNISGCFDQPNGILEQTNEALRELSHLSGYPEFEKDYDDLYNAYYTLIDIHDHIRNTFHRFDFDEYRFNELQEELYFLSRIKRKYGYTMADIYEARDELAQKIERSTHRDDILQSLYHQREELYQKLMTEGREIHRVRVQTAQSFEAALSSHMKDLYLPHAIFKVDIRPVEPNKEGTDAVTFMVAMNKGMAMSSLNESASGGEISRLMLAIKTITLKDGMIDTIIFDEVDTGVSGKVADAIGEKMHDLSADKQVICITHLPQVAVHADYHYAIVKESNDQQTYSSIIELDLDHKIEEIAKMLSGDAITEEAIQNAKRLLNI